MENLIIWIAMMFFTPTYHDYPMPSKSTAPITAYFDPFVLCHNPSDDMQDSHGGRK